MGTIIERRGRGGRISHSAQISIMRDGAIAHRESKTFYVRQAAKDWMEAREKDLAKPGALDRAKAEKSDPPLSIVIDRYTDETLKGVGRTKTQILRTIKALPIAAHKCSTIDTEILCDFAKALDCSPSTRGTYMSSLSTIFTIAVPMWKYPLNRQAMADAITVLNTMGIIAKSNERHRRPTLGELDKLMTFFGEEARYRGEIPMRKIIAFAIFSTRRQDEICRIERANHEPGRVLVPDMKHPGKKIGNDIWCDLVPEAEAILLSIPKIALEFFPVNTRTVSATFTRACQILGINTEDMPDAERLHFHDLRHEGISRLFEMGWTIPQVASVSGHRSWQSLKRYSHLRQTGDKYANWKWKDLL